MVMETVKTRRKSASFFDSPFAFFLTPHLRTLRNSPLKNFYASLIFILILAILLAASVIVLLHKWRRHPRPVFHPVRSFDSPETVILPPIVLSADTSSSPSWPPPTATDAHCHFHGCVNVYRCGRNDHHKIKVYIYPLYDYVSHDDQIPITPTPMSKEYFEILTAIYESEFHTNDTDEACLYIPSIDLLNEKRVDSSQVGRILSSLPFWNNGENHLIFNFLPGLVPDKESFPDVSLGRAMVAGGSFSTWTFRRNFDVSLPIPNPLSRSFYEKRSSVRIGRSGGKKCLATSAQVNIHPEYREALARLAQDHSDFLLLDRCDDGHHREALNLTKRCIRSENNLQTFPYPAVLRDATFCVVLRGSRLGQSMLTDAMAAGCIPVIVIDHYVLPFEDVIDWQKASVRLYEGELVNLLDILHNISPERVEALQKQISFIWSRYFSSTGKIALTSLQVINDRVFPYKSKSYAEWNEPNHFPAFFPLVGAPKRQGFTAVILTYDRITALFKLVQKIAHTESLTKIVVIWNNQKKRPPPSEDWPKLTKPLVVRETRANLLGNRFYPYEDIETEAVLALDDDINMLTSDELEFAYQVWSEHPDRLVGFPARLHSWDANLTRWKYDSEWMNEISMVLTGAAFYHKHYSYLYTTAMPGDIRSWVDEHMNCEDIAMNFLIANYSGKAPIKVTPRKKFKCPNCPVNGLSYATEHMVERSKCINYFAEVYGRMPLKTVEFRADPPLFLDNVPAPLNKWPGVGSL